MAQDFRQYEVSILKKRPVGFLRLRLRNEKYRAALSG